MSKVASWRKAIQFVIRRLFKFQILVVFLLFFFDPNLGAEGVKLSRDLDQRFREIVREKTRGYFKELVQKEKYLEIVSELLNKEIRLRQKEGTALSLFSPGVSGMEAEQLIKQYETELASILNLVDELKRLKNAAADLGDEGAKQKAMQLERRLSELLEGADISKDEVIGEKVSRQLLLEYETELKELVRIVRELQNLRQKSSASNIRSRVDAIEREVMQALNSEIDVRDPLVDSYAEELVKVVDVLRQLDELDRNAGSKDLAVHEQIRKLKQRIFKVVKPELLADLGYKEPVNYSVYQDFDTYFEEWKARQTLWFRAKLKQAALLKKYLIETGSDVQIKRMFNSDLLQAAKHFNLAEFETAGRLFSDILNDYPYKEMDDIRFYLAECYFATKQYLLAQDLYQALIEQGRHPEYKTKAYWRLFYINDAFKRYSQFFDYVEDYLKLSAYEQDPFYQKALFYAGFVAFKIGRFDYSNRLMQLLSNESEFYIPGKFLQAVNYFNLGQKEKAIPILTFLSKRESYAHSNQFTEAIRNLSLIKLALYYYEENDLLLAFNNLQNVSPETPGYDVALLARAWTWFFLGHLKEASNDLDRLIWNHLNSTYLYEAMMLSAHCNRLLGEVKASTRKVRYVENAQNVLDINQKMLQERERLHSLLMQLDRLEESVVLSGDQYAFEKIEGLRNNIEIALESMTYKGDPGLQLIHEYDEEQKRLEKLLESYHDLGKIADLLGRNEMKKHIRRAISKLESQLLDIQKFQTVKRVDILADYPLAQKESNLRYQRQKLQKMRQQVETENQKLEYFKEEIASLLQKAEQRADPELQGAIDYNQMELSDLKKRLEVFMVFLTENDLESLDTDFRKWSDFSGFGMSDMDFVRLKTIDRLVEKYNGYLSLINAGFYLKQKEILRRLAEMDEQIAALEENMYQKKITEMKEKREKYFKEDYFVRKTSELQSNPDQELKILLEEQMGSEAKTDSKNKRVPEK